MILIGKEPLGKLCAIHAKISNKNAPTNTTRTNNFPISFSLKINLHIWGTANPTNAIGPTKAVVAAVSKDDEIKISQRICFTFMPIVCA